MQDDSIFINRFENVVYNITRIRRNAIKLRHFKEKRYYSPTSLYLQVKCMCIHDSHFSAFSLVDVITNIVL